MTTPIPGECPQATETTGGEAENSLNLKPREKCVQELSKKYIGYRCIELDCDLHQVQTLTAGYLNLKDTHELRELIEKMEGLARNFLKLKNRGFDVPGVKCGRAHRRKYGRYFGREEDW
ncbi:hypothetical protein LTS07_007623 [Exophiala sideris]|uniref:Uncharacterized protein n=1 Tax=Exophiala sideris TaxID=1016849 RepID=A0ABR0JAN1_9EURO|nr:hypothetical protein LTS07_007623 [Exophiala sideris]KAK5059508.1 hypothetical protein LTR69_006097 [Exophiala sideris]